MRHLGSGAISIVLLIAICCVVAKGTHATLLISQDVATAWTSSQTGIEVKNISNDTPDPLVNYWAIPCTTAEHIPNPNGGTIDNCWQDVGYGRWNASKLYPGDSALGYPIKSSDGISLNTVIAIPRSRNLIVYDGLLRILPNFQSNFKPVRTLTGAISYMQLTTDVFSKTNRPHFSDGNFATTVQPGSYGFSADGMHLSYNKGAYQVMVNTDTMVATKFGTNSQQSSGVTPKVTTALSERGEVGFVANKDFNKYGMYDLNHCQPASDSTLPGVCPTRDVYQLLIQKIPGFRYINTTRFLSDTRIEFYAVVDSGGALHTNRYELRLPQNDENNLQYLAMGDSYTSGEGLGDYRTGTDSSENHCHTSLDSYPYLIKAEMGFTRADSVACASAKVKDIYTLNAKFYNSSEDGRQATGMEDDSFDTQIYQGFLPGYRIQESFIRAYRPSRATLSIGGNNIKFSEILKNCVMPGDCYSSDTEKVEFVSRLKALFPKLVDTYRAAIAEMPTYGRLYVFGYPYIAEPGGQCALNVHLSAYERQVSRQIITDLNRTIELAALKSGAKYIDVSEAFSGHKMCETNSGAVALNGLNIDMSNLLSLNINNLADGSSYHPNLLGHALIKAAVPSGSQNLTLPMPIPDNSVSFDAFHSTLLSQLSTNSTGYAYSEDKISPPAMVLGDSIIKVLSVNDYLLNPGANLRVEIHSEPQVVGSAVATSASDLQINAKIPNTIAPGVHTLHIYGVDINGKQVDIYKPVIIISSIDDIDGDGIVNDQDRCNFVQTTGIDQDYDGIDDSCDAYLPG